jgi:hypothetical protein
MSDIKVKFKRHSMEVDTEVGSIGELIGFLQTEETNLARLFGDDMETILERISQGGETEQAAAAPGEPKKERKKRGQPDPATAVAPAPLPVPSEVDPLAIPASLQRTAAPSATSPPPPPLMPAAPPLAPATPTPPTGVLAGKIIADLDGRKAPSADGGAALAAWLASAGIVKAGATYDEAISTVRLMSDDKLSGVAQGLGIS